MYLNEYVKICAMFSFMKSIFSDIKRHPFAFLTSFIIGIVLGLLAYVSVKSIISDIVDSVKEGSFSSLSLISLLGAIAGIISLSWIIIDKYSLRPRISVTAELSHVKGQPDKLIVLAFNFGGTTEVNEVGVLFSDDKLAYYHTLLGFLPQRVRAGGVPYRHEFEKQEIINVLKKEHLSIKKVFIRDEKQRIHYGDIPTEIVNAFNSMSMDNEVGES